jgi:hypothetical protein
VHHGINVERGDVAALEVTGIILRMIAPDAPADVIVEGDALTGIEEDDPAGIGLAEAGVILHDYFRP